MSTLPTGTVTFLIADIEASTRLVQEAGTERYTELLGGVRNVLRQAAVANGGVEVDAIGDEQLAVFADATDAVEAALATQRAMQANDWRTERPVRVRLGLHTGTPQLTDEGYVGIDIIRASRIALAGHGGETLLSSTTAAFATGFATRDLGSHQLAGLSEPERIHQLLADDLPRDFPPLRNTVS